MSERANSVQMPAIAVLSGGLATRLRPITTQMPKSLVPVAGEPFVGHQLRMLAREGFSKAVLLCGFMGEEIEAYVGDGGQFGIEVRYSFDGETLRGTGGAIRKALPLLGDCFMVIYGDSWCPTRYRPIWEFFVDAGKQGLMTVFENNGQWDTSNVIFEQGKILQYHKTAKDPAMRFIDYGIGAFDSRVFEAWEDAAVFDLATVQRYLLEQDQLAGYLVHERFYEIGSHSGLRETDEYIRAELLNNAAGKMS